MFVLSSPTRDVLDASCLPQIESKIDIQRIQREHEDARRRDAELARNQFEKVLENDQEIISVRLCRRVRSRFLIESSSDARSATYADAGSYACHEPC
jgi:hypothetical protein